MDDFYALVQDVGYDKALKQAAREIEVFSSAMHEICAAAQQQGIKVLVDAEDIRRQSLIDHIGLELMSSYNKGGRAVVLNTYQMYLKMGIEKLQAHLEHSAKCGYTLGVKLVRGAYISTEPNRNQIHDSKGATDMSYDRAVSLLISGPKRTSLEQTSNETLATTTVGPWTAEVMLATHNTHSAREALRLYKDTINHAKGHDKLHRVGLQSLVFAQLKGMADELSFELTARIKSLTSATNDKYTAKVVDIWDHFPKIGVYKYSVWGTFQECLLYLLRRAEENQDAASRSRTTALAMVKELFMRLNPFRRA
ncbi:hypothetical protein K4F52_002095 [Lecanicillium sp. MT-2017a]|nr:hypothetical protein K4F52_002095 [Lecanicillium sp. MT-2017a]